MEVLLLVAYLLVLAGLIVALVRVARQPIGLKYYLLFLGEMMAEIVACGLMWYFSQLPGTGPMPGLTWFGEVLISMGATVLYFAMVTVTMVIYIIKIVRGKNSPGK